MWPKKVVTAVLCIGQKNSNIEHKNFDETFLRNIYSKDHFGLIYGFPMVRRECYFHFEKIIEKLNNPKAYKRGLYKFKLNFKSLWFNCY